jgi:multicomponent Na+:H+ antiporter subunit D
MHNLTIFWIALPFFIGFTIYLLPKLDRYLAIAVTSISLIYGLNQLLFNNSTLTLTLLDNFGVTLIVDQLSSYFILTNAIVTSTVIIYNWQKDKTAFFYTQLIILHGSINGVFIGADFISIYVALEVIGIAAFLLISYPRSDRSIWIALRYLFVSNTAMLFYLIGALLVYKANHSFAISGLGNAPTEAIALIFLGFLTKGGIFVSGLWLPLTHAEAETSISALLSGVVIKCGVFGLIRCALIVPEIEFLIRIFGVATAILGIIYAILSQDSKRLLAFSTVSQLGFILAAPQVGGFYALTHGIVKSNLFLIAGNLPSRDFEELKHKPMATHSWIPLVIASLSISGFPLLCGFASKVLTLENLLPWQIIVMNLVAVGTVIAFAKFIFLPHENQKNNQPINFWIAIGILITTLILTNGIYLESYGNLDNIIKAMIVIIIGWALHLLLIQKIRVKLPQFLELIDNQIGIMSIILTLLFWMVLGQNT